MGIFGLVSFKAKSKKGGKAAKAVKINKSAKKKTNTCEFC